MKMGDSLFPLLCESSIDVVVDLSDLVVGKYNNRGSRLIRNSRESRHLQNNSIQHKDKLLSNKKNRNDQSSAKTLLFSPPKFYKPKPPHA